MTDRPTTDRLSAHDIQVLKFAAHRQLARWANKPELSSRQRTQRAALVRAVGVLGDQAFAHGCELHVLHGEEHADA